MAWHQLLQMQLTHIVRRPSLPVCKFTADRQQLCAHLYTNKIEGVLRLQGSSSATCSRRSSWRTPLGWTAASRRARHASSACGTRRAPLQGGRARGRWCSYRPRRSRCASARTAATLLLAKVHRQHFLIISGLAILLKCAACRRRMDVSRRQALLSGITTAAPLCRRVWACVQGAAQQCAGGGRQSADTWLR
jgi:hypothetical protein